MYGESEEFLGKVDAGKRFVIDTKTRGGFGGPCHATRQTVVAEGKPSRELLGSGVDVFYLHAPDTTTPIEETLAGVNEVYKTGFFKRFGLSNYGAEDVEKIYGICREKGYPLPSVYQGLSGELLVWSSCPRVQDCTHRWRKSKKSCCSRPSESCE